VSTHVVPARSLRRLPPRAVDAGVAIAVAIAVMAIMSVAEESGPNRSLDVLARALGLTVAALLLLRRDRPLLVLVGSIGALLVYAGLNYPAFSLAVPLAAAAYSAAVAGHIRPAAAILTLPILAGAGYQSLFEGASLGSVLATETLADAALLAAVLLLGEAVRHRRAWAGEVRQRLERESARRVEAERLRIARELHDVLAHTIAAVNVQAAVAAEAIDDAPAEARASLQTIRAQSRAAIAELKATVGLLRGDAGDAPRAPTPGLADIDALVDGAAEAGVDVRVSVAGPVRELPVAVDLNAYRIVQESLTNVVRHSGAATAALTIGYEPDAIVLRITDDGAATDGTGPGGYGLVGMRERAVALGGALDTGRAAGGGFAVHARLPTTRTST
jgi:signal transduction histidine kinase